MNSSQVASAASFGRVRSKYIDYLMQMLPARGKAVRIATHQRQCRACGAGACVVAGRFGAFTQRCGQLTSIVVHKSARQ